ncbi:hypothetical protein BAE44_0007750 [Dichanthelium oligosanthes]|uniref:DUF295 domain-containing protein n=1 Tax=Dichanthelium oligosanthes TaxID=888268 RepID=A0A1E5W1F3_9POAL|nr:hypothetical protein BAE44_0007750 [Dichanthelium oligosanthes]
MPAIIPSSASSTSSLASKPTSPAMDHFFKVVLSGDLVITWRFFARTIQCSARENRVHHLAVVELSENSNLVGLVFIGGALDARTMSLPDWKSGEAKWVRITSLGGCVLFFHDYSFAGSIGPDHPGIRKDCMYFKVKCLWFEYSLVDGSCRQSDVVYPGGPNSSAVLEFGGRIVGWE